MQMCKKHSEPKIIFQTFAEAVYEAEVYFLRPDLTHKVTEHDHSRSDRIHNFS